MHPLAQVNGEVLCQSGGQCSDMVNGYSCACADGVGDDCASINDCTHQQCINGAQCADGADGAYTCQCAAGFTGDCDVCAELHYGVNCTLCTAAGTCSGHGTCLSVDWPTPTDDNNDGSCVCDAGCRISR